MNTRWVALMAVVATSACSGGGTGTGGTTGAPTSSGGSGIGGNGTGSPSAGNTGASSAGGSGTATAAGTSGTSSGGSTGQGSATGFTPACPRCSVACTPVWVDDGGGDFIGAAFDSSGLYLARFEAGDVLSVQPTAAPVVSKVLYSGGPGFIPGALALDPSAVYVSTRSSVAPNNLFKISKTGVGGALPLVDGGLDQSGVFSQLEQTVMVSGGVVYVLEIFGDGSSSLRSPTTTFLANGVDQPWVLAGIDTNNFYFWDAHFFDGGTHVSSFPLSGRPSDAGSTPLAWASAGEGIVGMQLFDGYIYWAARLDDEVWRTPIAGEPMAGPGELLVAGNDACDLSTCCVGQPSGLAVDATGVYFSNGLGGPSGAVFRMPPTGVADGGAPLLVMGGLDQPVHVYLDAASVYAVGLNGQVWVAAKPP
jgi:hypothetical protein